MILCVDSLEDDYFTTKKNILCEIFDCLDSEDNISLISMNNKVNRVFSLVQKSQNTVQLYNQLKYLQPYKGKSLFLVKGIKKATEEIICYSKENILSKSLHNWII